jgi:hypothetical protein
LNFARKVKINGEIGKTELPRTCFDSGLLEAEKACRKAIANSIRAPVLNNCMKDAGYTSAILLSKSGF